MTGCCFCLSPEPLGEKDLKHARGERLAKFVAYQNEFQMKMLDAPCSCSTLPCCCIGTCPWIHLCVQTHMRYKVLNHLHPESGWDNYVCCQGYFGPCCCFAPGKCYEDTFPRTCMCCEALCCPGLAVSTTRMVVMDAYRITPDPCDNRLIRCGHPRGYQTSTAAPV